MQAPTRPKIAPDAPTDIYCGAKTAEMIVAPTPEITNRIAVTPAPCACSKAVPTACKATILIP